MNRKPLVETHVIDPSTYAAVKCVVCKACQRIRWMLLFHTVSSNDPLASEKAAIHRCTGLFACGPSLRRANLAKI